MKTLILISALFTLCYSKNIDIESKIVDGFEAIPNEFPFAVVVQPTKPQGLGLCGGSIINEDYILTSAFCLDMATDVRLILGAHDFTQNEPTQVIIESTPIENLIKHPLYNPSNGNFDIALIFTTVKITFNEVIKPIKLPELMDTDQFVNQLTYAIGWGQGSDNRLSLSQNLVITNGACQSTYGTNFVIESTICVGTTSRSGPCANDQGGPLFFKDPLINEYLQIGIISWPTCGSTLPDIYTRITSLRMWILQETGI